MLVFKTKEMYKICGNIVISRVIRGTLFVIKRNKFNPSVSTPGVGTVFLLTCIIRISLAMPSTNDLCFQVNTGQNGGKQTYKFTSIDVAKFNVDFHESIMSSRDVWKKLIDVVN